MEGSIWSRVQSTVTGKAREFIESHDDLVIGLDFGTSNSCVSIWRKDKHRVKIVKNTRDEKITPSAIHFYNNFENYHVGAVPHDDNTSYCTIQGVKSLLGATKLEDVPSYFTHKCSIEDRPDESDKQLIITVVDPTSGEEKQYTCEELIALIISYLRLSVFQYLKRKPIQKKKVDYDLQRVVIGVPAHFPEKKREALRAAAIMGGFEEVHFMIESTAAAMAYGLLVAGEKFVLVFDMGGGTTDLTVLYINNGRYDIQYTYGQSRLGGQDIDSILVQQMIQIITADLIYWEVTLPKEELLMTKNQQFIQKLYELCKECKEQLSTNSEHVFNYYGLLLLLKDNYQTVNQLIQSLEEKTSEKIDNRKKNQESSFGFTVTRKQFEKWISPVLDRIEQTVLHTLQQYKQKKQEEDKSGELFEETKDFAISIDEVVLVGGSSQIPSIQNTLRKACGTMGVHHFAVRNEFSSMIDEVDDDKEGEQSKDNDESPQTLVGKEFCVSINPNYAVVEGLAIRGAIIAGEDSTMLKDILMMDCLPMTLGLLLFSDNNDKYFEPIIYQGSKLPIEQRKRISIADRNQKFVTLEIYEEIEEILEANKMKYSYYLLVTCDALIENLEDDLPTDESRIVEVVFRVEEDSHLSYKVVEVRENKSSSANEVKSNKKKVDHSSQQMMLLVVYSCFLLLVYVGMKFLFSNTSQYTEEVVEIKSE